MAATVDQAICIRVWDWSETSQTVSLFGREQGLIRGVAKGAKRENSRFSGGLEVLTRGEILAILKPSTALATLTAWDLQETFASLRHSLSSFYSGMYIADLIQHTMTERDPHPPLYDALLEALRNLGGPRRDRLTVLKFQWATLNETGYRPELETDVLSGAALSESKLFGFLPSLGGFSADAARRQERIFQFSPGVGPVPAGPVWRVRHETLETLRALAGSAGDLSRDRPDEAIRRASRLLASYLRHIIGRDMASMALLFGQTPR